MENGEIGVVSLQFFGFIFCFAGVAAWVRVSVGVVVKTEERLFPEKKLSPHTLTSPGRRCRHLDGLNVAVATVARHRWTWSRRAQPPFRCSV